MKTKAYSGAPALATQCYQESPHDLGFAFSLLDDAKKPRSRHPGDFFVEEVTPLVPLCWTSLL
jgi:hypothetical protein